MSIRKLPGKEILQPGKLVSWGKYEAIDLLG